MKCVPTNRGGPTSAKHQQLVTQTNTTHTAHHVTPKKLSLPLEVIRYVTSLTGSTDAHTTRQSAPPVCVNNLSHLPFEEDEGEGI